MGALCAGRHDVGLKQLEVELDEQIRVDFVIFRRDFYGFPWISSVFLRSTLFAGPCESLEQAVNAHAAAWCASVRAIAGCPP